MQSQSQLKAIYKDNADTIVGNCDTTLFLGGKEKTTLKEISEILGKETMRQLQHFRNQGRELSHGLNYQKLGKQLMMLMYGKEASNRKQEIDRQHHTIPNQRSEMCITGYGIMDNSIHSTWKS